MALVGGSLGGAIALDFALAYPEAVEKVVLIDAQVKGGLAGSSNHNRQLVSLPHEHIRTHCGTGGDRLTD